MTTVLAKAFPQAAAQVAKANLQRKRVLIVGGGFAGVAAARALKRTDVDILLVDRRNHHIFQPLLYQVATAVLSPSEIAAPIRQLEAKQKNVSVSLAEVKGINLRARTVDVHWSRWRWDDICGGRGPADAVSPVCQASVFGVTPSPEIGRSCPYALHSFLVGPGVCPLNGTRQKLHVPTIRIERSPF